MPIRHSRRHRWLATAAVLAAGLPFAMLGPTATQAQASTTPRAQASPTCTGDSCDGTDPFATGCADGSQYIVTSSSADGGTLELWWSPVCQTNWTEFVPGDSDSYEIWVTRDSDGVWAGNGLENPFQFQGSPGVTAWSDQMYSPGPASACVLDLNFGAEACISA